MLTAAGAAPAAAQDAWQQHTAAGEWAFRQGDHARAEREFRAALEVAQSLPPESRRLDQSLYNLGRLYEEAGRMDEAQATYLLLLALEEHRFGEAAPELLDTLLAVARMSQAAGDLPQAQDSLRRYLTIAEASHVADPGQRWRGLSLLARMETLQQHPAEALELQRTAVAALAADEGAAATERARELETLASMEIAHGTPQAAEGLLEDATAVREAAELGGAVEVLAGAASAALGAGELELAERLATRAVAAAGGGTLPLVVDEVFADVAWLRVRRGSESVSELLLLSGDEAALAEADRRLRALLERQDLVLAARDPARVSTLDRLVRTAAMAGDAGAAADWQRRLCEAIGEEDFERWLRAQDALAYLLAEADRPEEALAVNTKLLARLDASWAAGDPRFAPVLERQAGLLDELGRSKEAKAVRKRIKALES
jgi:tetratricopeptide (TPR) repeat protein